MINLADIEKPLEPVRLPSGREVRVVAANGVVAQLKDEYEKTEDHRMAWQIAAELLPDATPEEISKLTMAQCSAVIGIASGKADQIAAEIAKAAEEQRAREGNQTATTGVKPKVRRRGTGSAS